MHNEQGQGSRPVRGGRQDASGQHLRYDGHYHDGKRWWIRVREKGGKLHEVPAHRNAEAYLDAYVHAAGIWQQKKKPLFRAALGRTGDLSDRRITRNDALRVVRRRVFHAGLPESIRCRSFRDKGITAYLQIGGTIERAHAIAAHESPRTTKLYDGTVDQITLDEVERIVI